jgi:hypothetical protein
MAQWHERSDSGEASLRRAGAGEQSSFKKVWIVEAGEDYTEAHQEFLRTLDGQAGSLQGPYGIYHFNFDSYTAKHVGNGYWEVEATYVTVGGGQQDSGGGGEDKNSDSSAIGVITTLSFDTTGGTRRITSALSESRYGNGAPDMKKAINVTDDSVDGTDITVPVFEWQEEYEVPGYFITQTYARKVANLTGKVNSSSFRGFEAGEVLFLGCSGTTTYNPAASVGSPIAASKLQFRFAAQQNKSDVGPIGDITGIPKKGWEYLWIQYFKSVNGPFSTPKYVYVNQVYETADFSILRLPG